MSSIVIELVKTLSASKNVDSRLLNTLGVQVARTVAARGIYNLRATPAGDGLDAKAAAELQREGVVVCPDLLPAGEFQALRAECGRLLADGSFPRATHHHGPTTVEQLDLLAAGSPAITRFLSDPRVRSLAEAAEKHPVELMAGHRRLERVTQGAGDEEDGETVLHSDTFFNTHKAWLYLEDVTLERAPFVYVKRSHHLSLGRLRRLYDESRHQNRGSRRITADELAAEGLEETVFTCRANTLVMANTCGYHRRMRGVAGHQRLGLHLSFRYNPFWPQSLHMEDRLSRRNPLVRRVVQALGVKAGA